MTVTLPDPDDIVRSDPYVVRREALVEYAAASLQHHPAVLDGEEAPPTFAFVPVWPMLGVALAAFLPSDALASVVHARHDLEQHRPLRPGDEVTVTARVLGARKLFASAAIVLESISTVAEGTVVNVQRSTIAVRGVRDVDGPSWPRPPRVSPSEGVTASTAVPLPRDLGVRYGMVSGDTLPIHMSDEGALGAGLPRMTLQGMCAAAVAIDIAVAAAERSPTAVRRLAVEFAAPVFLGEDLVVTSSSSGDRISFSASGPDGRRRLRDGELELASH